MLPDHGWPIAAAYALEQSNRWLYRIAAGLTLMGFAFILGLVG